MTKLIEQYYQECFKLHFSANKAVYGESDHAIFKAGWDNYSRPDEAMIDPFSGYFCLHYTAGVVHKQKVMKYLQNKKLNELGGFLND